MIYSFPNLKALIELHNEERAKKVIFTLPVLTIDNDLTRYAELWSETMSKNETLQHSKVQNILKIGYKYCAENIAVGQYNETDVMSSWMSSPKHRANIMNRHFNNIGAAFSYSKQDKIYWCVCFGGLRSKK